MEPALRRKSGRIINTRRLLEDAVEYVRSSENTGVFLFFSFGLLLAAISASIVLLDLLLPVVSRYYPEAPVGIFTVGLAGVTLVVLSPFFGYCVRIAQSLMRGERALPPLTDWVEMTRVGFEMAIVLVFVYVLPELLVDVALVIVPAELSVFVSDQTVTTYWKETLGNTPVGRLYDYFFRAVAIYLFPAVIALYARRERLSDLVPFSKYKRFLTDTTYAKMAAIVLVLYTACQLITDGFVRIADTVMVLALILFRSQGFDLLQSPIVDLYVFPIVQIWVGFSITLTVFSVVTFYVVGKCWELVPGSREDQSLLVDKTKQRRISDYRKR